jgi:hypothetical protein
MYMFLRRNIALGILASMFALLFPAYAYATDTDILIVKSEGEVTAKDARGTGNASVADVAGNVVRTGPNGRAVVRVGKSGYVVLEKNSTIEINKSEGGAGFFRHVTGLIYYALNKVKGDKGGYKVKTVAATIGVRGTRFLIADTEGRSELAMRKGLVSVASDAGEFEIHHRSEMDEFEAFKHEGEMAIEKERKDFEVYKSDLQKEFVEYKQEFSLGANRMASFDGKRVVERELSEETKREIEGIEDFAAEWIKDVDD